MKNYPIEIESYLAEVQTKADKIVDKFIIGFFVLGLCFAPLHQTWAFSLAVGGLNVLLYILAKFLPKIWGRQVISLVFSVFMLQFIGQSHGMAEFHFFFFTNIAILIIYQDWRVMIPYTIFAIGHHSTFFYFQLLGNDQLGEYFINYTEVNLTVLVFHFGIAILMAVICAWWAVIFRNQSIEMIRIQGESKEKNDELHQTEEELKQNIEELRITQESISRQNEQLSLIFDGVPGMIYQFKMTPDGTMSFPLVSKGSEIVFGLEPETVMSDITAVIERINPEDLLYFQQTIAHSAQTMQNWTADLRVNLHGQERWIRVSSKPVLLEDGSVLWSGIVREITQLKNSELQIKESEEKLHSILSETQDVIWSVGLPDQLTLFISPSVEKLYGISVEEWLQDVNWWKKIIYPEDKSIAQEMNQLLEKTGKAEVEYRIMTKGGETKWIATKSKIIFDQQKRPVRIDSIASDITKRKETEEQIRQLSVVAQKTSNGVVITDKNNLITWINASFEKITGYSFEEVKGKNPKMLQGKDTDPKHRQIIRENILRKEPFTQEILNYSKEGASYWIELSVTPILDKNGEIEQFIGIEKDVTRRKKADEENQLLAEMVQMQNQELQTSLGQVLELREQSEVSRRKAEKLLKNVTQSINYAKRIQEAIIPKESELQKYLDCFVFFRPKDIVSGDFYWFAEKENKKILVVGDCTGHGVSGALMTMIGTNILNQIVHNYEIHQPDQILNIMPVLLEQTLLHAEGKIKDGMDISIIMIENQSPQGSKVSYAGAMNSLYYVQNQEFTEIKANKVPIGGKRNEDFVYQKHEIFVENPTTFYLRSDGFQDQFGGADNSKFMTKNFKKLLLDISNKTITEQKMLIENTFADWKGRYKQTDDVLVIGLRV